MTDLPQGMACLQARIRAATSVDLDPKEMFDIVIARRKTARDKILQLAQQAYGTITLSWDELRQRLLDDPRDKFRDADDIHASLESVIARAKAALPRMLASPPLGDVVVKAVPEYQLDSAPDGRFVPASDDGSRPATFFYLGVPARFHRVAAQSLTMHETIPGHYLQMTMLAQISKATLHPIARLIVIDGSAEGWATYAEHWAAELGLYSSPFDEMGSLVNSPTPSAVADLGMQVAGWSVERAALYLHDEWLLESREIALKNARN